MNQSSLVSIVVPVYNAQPDLPKCLDSLIHQSHSELQIILVNDGSTDASGKICDEYAQQDSRIEVIHKANGGVSSARNAGLERIKGDYLLFADADDWLAENMVEVLLQTIDQDSTIDAVFCGFSIVDESGQTTIQTISPQPENMVQVVDRNTGVAEIFGVYITMPWNKFFRLPKEQKLPRFDETISLGEDELWEIETLKQARQIALIGDPLYYYREKSSSLSRDQKLSPGRLSLLDSQEKVLELIRQDYQDPQLIRLAQERLYYCGQDLMKAAYYQKQFALYEKIDAQIEEERQIWFTHHTNVLGSCRRRFVEWMMHKRLPGCLIRPFDK